MFTAAVITVSDSCFAGRRTDLSGPAVAEALHHGEYEVLERVIVPDEIPAIEDALIRACTHASLVVTTGGTGIAMRDVTPEATVKVCDRLVDGLAAQMRAEGLKQTPFAPLSRAICGTRGKSLVINLPGSPRGAVASLNVILAILPHALRLLSGAQTVHDEHE